MHYTHVIVILLYLLYSSVNTYHFQLKRKPVEILSRHNIGKPLNSKPEGGIFKYFFL